MRNTSEKIPNEYSRAMKKPSSTSVYKTVIYKTMINNTILKLRNVIAIGILISLSACSGYTLNSNESGSEMPIYPVIQF